MDCNTIEGYRDVMKDFLPVSNVFQIPPNQTACTFQSLFPFLDLSVGLMFGDCSSNCPTLLADVVGLHIIKEWFLVIPEGVDTFLLKRSVKMINKGLTFWVDMFQKANTFSDDMLSLKVMQKQVKNISVNLSRFYIPQSQELFQVDLCNAVAWKKKKNSSRLEDERNITCIHDHTTKSGQMKF
ncbi:hypothetical protein LXL04_010642 [Taraxacum kok-saghyz]